MGPGGRLPSWDSGSFAFWMVTLGKLLNLCSSVSSSVKMGYDDDRIFLSMSWGGCDDRVHTHTKQIEQGLPRCKFCTITGHCYFYMMKSRPREVVRVARGDKATQRETWIPRHLNRFCVLTLSSLYPESLPTDNDHALRILARSSPTLLWPLICSVPSSRCLL